MSSTEVNKTVVRRLFAEVYNGGNLALADELLAANYIGHNPLPGQPPRVEGFKWAMVQLRAAFPDLHMQIESLLAEDDRVVVQLTAHGTQRGTFMGMPPTGRRAVWLGFRMFRLAGGRIIEHWGVWDTLGMLQQLGVNAFPS